MIEIICKCIELKTLFLRIRQIAQQIRLRTQIYSIALQSHSSKCRQQKHATSASGDGQQ
jgi:hypothetical protein